MTIACDLEGRLALHRDSLIQIAEGDSELATMIISAATDRAMERTKVEKLEGQNQALLNRLREETRLRKTLHNQIEDIKGQLCTLAPFSETRTPCVKSLCL